MSPKHEHENWRGKGVSKNSDGRGSSRVSREINIMGPFTLLNIVAKLLLLVVFEDFQKFLKEGLGG